MVSPDSSMQTLQVRTTLHKTQSEQEYSESTTSTLALHFPNKKRGDSKKRSAHLEKDESALTWEERRGDRMTECGKHRRPHHLWRFQLWNKTATWWVDRVKTCAGRVRRFPRGRVPIFFASHLARFVEKAASDENSVSKCAWRQRVTVVRGRCNR